jgi:Zn-dependent M28 family amino/carboxypeptidase
MRNIIARFPGNSGRAIAVTGHYDTKVFRDFRFVGANDAGSSTGFLLELARVLAGAPRKDDVYLVWFDGEEAFGEWSATDGLYGSRHLAARWAADGTARRLKALINVDMIGDRDLAIAKDSLSSPVIGRLVWQVASDLGYGRHFLNQGTAVEDDHIPFARLGVPALDLIDFDYGPDNSWWHTEEDTMDKLSASSFQVVGDVVLETIRRLERQ